MWTLASTRIVRYALAPILSLWIAGAGCMMGCEGAVAATVPNAVTAEHSSHHSAREAQVVASGHACSSNGSTSCCTKNSSRTKTAAKRTGKSDTTPLTLGGSPSGMMRDCPLAVGRAAIAAKTRTDERAAALTAAHSNLPAENVPEPSSPPSFLPRLPDRGHTYLRCCVFLI
jgi:hypothetical protein